MKRLKNILLVAAIPAFLPPQLRLMAFVPVVFAAFTLQAQATVALNNWMISFIDGKKRGRYISLRETLALIVTVTLSIGGGYFLDTRQGEYAGFLLIFLVAFAAGAVEVVLLSRIPDHIAPAAPAKQRKFISAIIIPLKGGLRKDGEQIF